MSDTVKLFLRSETVDALLLNLTKYGSNSFSFNKDAAEEIRKNRIDIEGLDNHIFSTITISRHTIETAIDNFFIAMEVDSDYSNR